MGKIDSKITVETFQFKDTDRAPNLFALQEFGNIYARLIKPTNSLLKKRIVLLEGGVGALAVASEQSLRSAPLQVSERC